MAIFWVVEKSYPKVTPIHAGTDGKIPENAQ
jgi:hypothetical protein